MKAQKTIQIGAEAEIILKGNEIIKRRKQKSYRILEIDEKIRKLRTRAEGKILGKASELIDVPKIKKIDEKNKELIIEFVKGKKLSETFEKFPENTQKEISKLIGKNIAKLHSKDIIHGDLTTSNMIYSEKESKLFFIDFGLGFISHKIEDKAVDLHLLKQALEAKHYKNFEILFETILKNYKIYGEYEKVFTQLKKIEKRGRYK